MAALRIFLHSVRMAIGNLAEAVRVFGLLYVPIAAMDFLPDPEEGSSAASSVSYFFYVALPEWLLFLFLFSWMAIAWHRYILLGERFRTILPPFRRDRWVAYARLTVLLTLIMVVLVAAGFGALYSVVVWFDLPALIMSGGYGIGLVALVVFYRLSIALPASSVDQPLSIKGHGGPRVAQNGQFASFSFLGPRWWWFSKGLLSFWRQFRHYRCWLCRHCRCSGR
ncbi:membrane hypothetical protein [Rhizobium sp. EC-SD404]|nr:membrane hypothetical protein [Rhizobium sp. EC-SD404]